MPTSILEIIELSDGEVVLQRSEDEGEPLLTMRFSEESRIYLRGNGLEVARAMIQAGLQAAADLAEQDEMEIESLPGEAVPILH